MSYTCYNHEARTKWPAQMVQDGWTDDGRRRMVVHRPDWQPVECGHITSAIDPECSGCKWRQQ